MGKKVVISIPVHEQPLVVADHLRNIKKFVPNSAVILHASADGPPNFKEDILSLSNNEFKNFAYVNDTYYHTYAANEAGNVYGLSTVHSSNFRYINNIIDFDIFALETSNDMFVRKGVESLFEQYRCACGIKKDDVEAWRSRDIGAKNLIDSLNRFAPVKFIEKHAQEGTFYPKDVFKKVSDIVLDGLGGFVPAEELVLHTLAFSVDPSLYENVYVGSYVFHNAAHGATANEDILKVKSGVTGHYAVKRVPRRMNDACRIFVNEVNKND